MLAVCEASFVGFDVFQEVGAFQVIGPDAEHVGGEGGDAVISPGMDDGVGEVGVAGDLGEIDASIGAVVFVPFFAQQFWYALTNSSKSFGLLRHGKSFHIGLIIYRVKAIINYIAEQIKIKSERGCVMLQKPAQDNVRGVV